MSISWNSPFLPTQQVEEFFKIGSTLVGISAYYVCSVYRYGKDILSHFSSFHENGFHLTSLGIQGSEFGKTNVHDFFSFISRILNNSRLFNNYSSSPNGLLTQRLRGREE